MKLTKETITENARCLLGNEWTTEREVELINECLTGFVRGPGHNSHSQAAHLERINKILGTYGVEGMLLDCEGQDMSGFCDPSLIEHDILYCNTGDTYALTVMYYNGRLEIGCWGDIVESLTH